MRIMRACVCARIAFIVSAAYTHFAAHTTAWKCAHIRDVYANIVAYVSRAEESLRGKLLAR